MCLLPLQPACLAEPEIQTILSCSNLPLKKQSKAKQKNYWMTAVACQLDPREKCPADQQKPKKIFSYSFKKNFSHTQTGKSLCCFIMKYDKAAVISSLSKGEWRCGIREGIQLKRCRDVFSHFKFRAPDEEHRDY